LNFASICFSLAANVGPAVLCVNFFRELVVCGGSPLPLFKPGRGAVRNFFFFFFPRPRRPWRLRDQCSAPGPDPSLPPVGRLSLVVPGLPFLEISSSTGVTKPPAESSDFPPVSRSCPLSFHCFCPPRVRIRPVLPFFFTVLRTELGRFRTKPQCPPSPRVAPPASSCSLTFFARAFSPPPYPFPSLLLLPLVFVLSGSVLPTVFKPWCTLLPLHFFFSPFVCSRAQSASRISPFFLLLPSWTIDQDLWRPLRSAPKFRPNQ